MSDNKLTPARLAAKIANETINRLRAAGLDCVNKGGYYDVSPRIHDAVLSAAREGVEAALSQVRDELIARGAQHFDQELGAYVDSWELFVHNQEQTRAPTGTNT